MWGNPGMWISWIIWCAGTSLKITKEKVDAWKQVLLLGWTLFTHTWSRSCAASVCARVWNLKDSPALSWVPLWRTFWRTENSCKSIAEWVLLADAFQWRKGLCNELWPMLANEEHFQQERDAFQFDLRSRVDVWVIDFMETFPPSCGH